MTISAYLCFEDKSLNKYLGLVEHRDTNQVLEIRKLDRFFKIYQTEI